MAVMLVDLLVAEKVALKVELMACNLVVDLVEYSVAQKVDRKAA